MSQRLIKHEARVAHPPEAPNQGLLSQFTRSEIRDIIIAWGVISFAMSFAAIISLGGSFRLGIDEVVAVSIATATGFILHELGHKFVAIRYGYVAHFKIWTWGIILLLIMAVGTQGRFLFGAPGAVYIAPAAAAAGYYGYGYYSSTYRISDPEKENMIISAAGPVINLAGAIFFYTLLAFSGSSLLLALIGVYGFGLNLGLGSFNMLPIPPLDGFKIFKKNIPIALLIALPLWAMAIYFFFLQ